MEHLIDDLNRPGLLEHRAVPGDFESINIYENGYYRQTLSVLDFYMSETPVPHPTYKYYIDQNYAGKSGGETIGHGVFYCALGTIYFDALSSHPDINSYSRCDLVRKVFTGTRDGEKKAVKRSYLGCVRHIVMPDVDEHQDEVWVRILYEDGDGEDISINEFFSTKITTTYQSCSL